MPRVFLGVGSNLGEREKNLNRAQGQLRDYPQVVFLRSAEVYETEPQDCPPQDNFLNTVWEIETSFSPEELIKVLRNIEISLGRLEKIKNGPRQLDLDILFYGDLVYNSSGLQIPHPRLQEREFVLKPLAELVPELKHPLLGLTVLEMLEALAESKKNI